MNCVIEVFREEDLFVISGRKRCCAETKQFKPLLVDYVSVKLRKIFH